MTNVVYNLTAADSRIFSTVSMLLSYNAMSIYANAGTLKSPLLPKVALECGVAGGYVIAELKGYLDCLAKGASFPDPIKLRYEPAHVMPTGLPYVATKGSGAISATVQAAIFATFAEQAKDWVDQNISRDHARYPPIANFARVVRNAVAHGGRVNMDNPNATSVSWRGKMISHADNKRQIIGTSEYGPGDTLLLLIDLDEELKSLGASNPLY